MLDIQALKFARLFRKQIGEIPLILTRKEQLQFENNLMQGLDKARKKGKSTDRFEECYNEFRDAMDEERIVILPLR